MQQASNMLRGCLGVLAKQRGLRHQTLRICADTSVIGGCTDEELRESSLRLIERCVRGR